MSRHVEILRQAGSGSEVFDYFTAAPASPQRATGFAESRSQWKQLVHELLGRGWAPPSSIGLASATAGEGASYVARHLSEELARTFSRPTLLLEANLYNPAQAAWFGLAPDPGLRRLLEEAGFPLEDCLRRSPVDGLWLLPAGASPSSAAPDWAGFRALLPRLRDRFAVIVVDLPPVNLSPDFLILGPLLDGLLLVVQADCSSREVVRNAAARLRRANPNLLGTVLNRRKFVIPGPIYRRL